MMDKTTGELFIKRPSDGKVVSFYQNKKLINNFASDMGLLLVNNSKFKYPSKDETSFCISTNYDLITINNESLYDLIIDNIAITGEPNDINKLVFTVSGKSNGFFCRNTTRDVDKPFIEFLTNIYNTTFKEYGETTNEIYLAEHEKFINNSKWEMTNASIIYDIECVKDNVIYSFTDIVDYIRLNEDNCIIFPDSIYKTIKSYDIITVSIKSINYDKIHFMTENKELFNNDFIEAYNKLIHNDNRIELGEFNVTHFIDNANNIIILGNESIVVFLDIKHINTKMYEENPTIEIVREIQEDMTDISDNIGDVTERVETLENENRLILKISDTQPTTECLWFMPIE